LAAWLGLVPRQITIGGKARLVGITKRGNKLLAQVAGPRRTSRHAHSGQQHCTARSLAPEAAEKVHNNAAVVALANKLARIAWAVLQRFETFDASAAAA
jgi:transposase